MQNVRDNALGAQKTLWGWCVVKMLQSIQHLMSLSLKAYKIIVPELQQDNFLADPVFYPPQT